MSHIRNIEDYYTGERRITSLRLKNRLFKDGIKDKKCESCDRVEWLAKEIPLQLHHIDGLRTNNELSNLQILCPNCHSLTENFSGKNIKKKSVCVPTEEILKVIPQVCNIREILNYFGMSPKGGNYIRMRHILEKNPEIQFLIKVKPSREKKPAKNKINWPEPSVMQSLVWQHTARNIGKTLGVSDKSVEKFCKKHNLSKPSRGYWQKLKSINEKA